MKTRNLYSHLITAFALALSVTGRSDAVWITNFDSVTAGPGGSASGVWREVTIPTTGAGTDSSFAVTLTTDGDVKSISDPTLPSRIDESFPWRDIAAFETVTLPDGTTVTTPIPIDLPFSIGSNGDFINVETEGGATSVVTLSLGAKITNPMVSFSDIDVNTTLRFASAFSVPSQTTNLNTGVAMEVSNNGTVVPAPFEEEAAGSLQFTGEFTVIKFSIINTGPAQDGDDRTGFVVSSVNAPVAIPEPSPVMLGMVCGCVMMLLRRR